MFQVVFAALALVAASIHLGLSSSRRSSGAAIAATYLLYMLVIYVGLMGLLTAYAHVFRPLQTSASIGWSTSPYEYEVGMADLTVGVLGIFVCGCAATSGWQPRLPMRSGCWETQ
jgi:hypothetical protein